MMSKVESIASTFQKRIVDTEGRICICCHKEGCRGEVTYLPPNIPSYAECAEFHRDGTEYDPQYYTPVHDMIYWCFPAHAGMAEEFRQKLQNVVDYYQSIIDARNNEIAKLKEAK
jgi:hypothetical protein